LARLAEQFTARGAKLVGLRGRARQDWIAGVNDTQHPTNLVLPIVAPDKKFFTT